jgi:hypothetical protein
LAKLYRVGIGIGIHAFNKNRDNLRDCCINHIHSDGTTVVDLLDKLTAAKRDPSYDNHGAILLNADILIEQGELELLTCMYDK